MRRGVSRVVLDTNVYVSAYGFGGKPADVMRAAITGEFELVSSPAILVEVADKLETVLGFDREHTEAVILQITRVATIVRPSEQLAVVDDEADNRILEAAALSGAEYVVSGDHHLLDLGTWSGVRMLAVADFLSR